MKKLIEELLWKYAIQSYGKGSCGELGDSYMAINSDSFSDLADEIITITQTSSISENYKKLK